MNTVEERIAVLEAKVELLSVQVSTHAEETRTEYKTLESKLDDILALKNKGMGAIWLASALFGSGLIGLATVFVNWLKG